MKIYVKLFAALNLGDDLFLKILLERYPNVRFTLSAPETYKDIFKDYNNLVVVKNTLNISKNIFQKILDVLERNLLTKRYKMKLQLKFEEFFNKRNSDYDAFISIGGSIFMQPKKLPVYESIEYYKIVNKKFKNVFFIGCNFGPYTDDSYRENYTTIFNNATDVCFREKESYELFSHLKNIRLCPDIVFGLNYRDIKIEPNTVGFSIITARNTTDKKSYIRKYTELIEYYQNKNYKIFLFSFCKMQGDEDIIQEITENLTHQRNINKVFYIGDINTFLDSYAAVEKMFCGRFHAMILSMIFNQKIYPVIYSKKMTNVLNDINYKGKIIPIEEFYKIDPNTVYKEIDNNYYNIELQREESVKQFKMIDLFINAN